MRGAKVFGYGLTFSEFITGSIEYPSRFNRLPTDYLPFFTTLCRGVLFYKTERGGIRFICIKFVFVVECE